MTGTTKGFGDHLLIDLHGCDAEVIGASGQTEAALLEAAERCGATIIEHHFHQFSPHGVSGMILIAESHLSVHTWPENGFVAVDIFTCGKNMRPEVAIEVLEGAFNAERVNVMKVTRGDLPTN